MTSKFANMTSSWNFLDVAVFLLSSLVTGPSFMPISWLVVELRQFSFITDWPEIQKQEIHLSQFFPTSGDWGKLRMQKMVQTYLIKNWSFHQFSKNHWSRIWSQNKDTGTGKRFLSICVLQTIVSFCIMELKNKHLLCRVLHIS